MPGIEEPEKIDVIAEDEDGSALLSIVQAGPWPTQDGVPGALKRKLSTYLRYALEGQMVKTYPTLEGRPVTIALMHQDDPPPAVRTYWERRQRDVRHENVTLIMRSLDETVWRA